MIGTIQYQSRKLKKKFKANLSSRTRWVIMRRRRRQSVLQLRQMRGIPRLCPHLLRRGPWYIQCRQQNIVSCASGGHPQPTPPKARAICPMLCGQRHAARACRIVALPRSRQGPQHHWKGEKHAKDARPTSRARGIVKGVCSAFWKGMPRCSALRIYGQRTRDWLEGHGESVYRCWSRCQIILEAVKSKGKNVCTGRNDYANNRGNLSHGEPAG
jgi:hypothetical protein